MAAWYSSSVRSKFPYAKAMDKPSTRPFEWLWHLVFFTVLLWSDLSPKDRFTWFLEVLPALIGWVLVVTTRTRFPLTPLVFWFILAHMVILMVGGHYTYAEVPLFDWIRDHFNGGRNHYDRVGHFAQGFVPALIAREILWRRSPLQHSRWLPWVVVAFCLSISALYELFECGVALATGESADAFLGTQGDPWDTQSDLFLCLLGAATAVILLGRIHIRQLAALRNASS